MVLRTLRVAAVAAALALLLPGAAHAFSFPLAGWWPMNEGSGQTVRDWSGRGNTGFLGSTPAADANDPTWIRGVLLGSALRFDGVDDYVTIPGTNALEPQRLTVAAWVRGTSPDQFRYVLAKGADACNNSSYGMYTTDGRRLAFYIADAERVYRSPEADPAMWDGKWHHVAGTFDGKEVQLFVDGVAAGPATPAETQINYALPSSGGMIGAYPGPCRSFTLAGDIDGVQIWSQALPVDDIWNALKPIVSLAR